MRWLPLQILQLAVMLAVLSSQQLAMVAAEGREEGEGGDGQVMEGRDDAADFTLAILKGSSSTTTPPCSVSSSITVSSSSISSVVDNTSISSSSTTIMTAAVSRSIISISSSTLSTSSLSLSSSSSSTTREPAETEMATIETETTNVLPAASSHPLAETTTSTNRNSDHLQTTNTTTNTTTTAANTTIYMSTTITTIISSAVEDLSLSLSTRDDSVPPSPLNLLDTQSSPLLSSTSLLSSATTSSSIISTKPSVISTPTAPSIIDTSTTCSFLTSILSTSDTLSSYTQSSSVPSPSSSFTTTILPSNESSSSLIPAAVIQSTATTSLTPKEQANSYEEELSASPPSSTLSNIIEETIQPDLPRPVDGVIVKEEEENEITRNSAIGISDNIINLIEQGNEQDEAGSGDGASHGGDEGGISVIDLIDPFRREGKEETAIAAEGVVEEKELRLDQYIQDHGINSGGKEEEVVVDVEVATTTSIIVEIQVDASSDSSQGGIVAAVESERNVVTDRVSSLPHESSSSRTGDLMSSTVPSSVVGDLVFDNASSVFLDKDDAGNVITSSSPKQQQPEEGVGRDSHQQSNTPTTSSTSSSNQQEQALPSSSSQQQQQQSSSYTIFAKPQHSSATTRFNYASFDCGARILAHTPNAKTPHAILLSSKDQYMLQRCNTGTTSTTTTNKFVVIELCQEILVDTLRMANFEFFSSMFKGVRVSVTSVYTGAHQPLAATTGGDGGELGKDGEWVLLGDFQALNVRVMQEFTIPIPKIWSKYIKIEFSSQYGREYYCPLSFVGVYGTTMMEDLASLRNQVDNDVIAEDIQNPLYDPHAHPLILQLTGGSASTSTPNQQSSAHYPSSSDFATSPIWNPDESGNLHIHTCLTRAPPATHNFHDLSISRLNFRRSETAERLKRFVDSPDIWEYLSPMSGGDSNVDGQYQSSQTQQQYSQSSPSPPTTSPPLQSPHPSQPPISLTPDSGTQESVFKTIVKRLKVLEANYTRSFKFMQEQSRVFLDILHKIDQEHSDGLELLYDEVDKTLTQLYMELQKFDDGWKDIFSNMQQEKVSMESKINALGEKMISLTQHTSFILVWQAICTLAILAPIVSRILESPLVYRLTAGIVGSTNGTLNHQYHRNHNQHQQIGSSSSTLGMAVTASSVGRGGGGSTHARKRGHHHHHLLHRQQPFRSSSSPLLLGTSPLHSSAPQIPNQFPHQQQQHTSPSSPSTHTPVRHRGKVVSGVFVASGRVGGSAGSLTSATTLFTQNNAAAVTRSPLSANSPSENLDDDDVVLGPTFSKDGSGDGFVDEEGFTTTDDNAAAANEEEEEVEEEEDDSTSSERLVVQPDSYELPPSPFSITADKENRMEFFGREGNHSPTRFVASRSQKRKRRRTPHSPWLRRNNETSRNGNDE